MNTSRQKAGTKLRILYKAEGDWAVSLQKSYDSYALRVITNSGTVTRNQFITPGDYNGVAVSGTAANNPQIRVPYTDLNKSFLVTLQYRLSDGSVKRLSPIQMVADGDSALSPAIEFSPPDITKYDTHFAYIDVAKYLAKPELKVGGGGFVDAADWYPYGTIRGVSAKARVIYHDNNNTVNSWRVQDLDTFLTPAAQEDVK